MITLTQILKMSKNSPLCTHFLETRKNAKMRSAMSWLAMCDLDTLHLINQTITKMASEQTTEVVPIVNVGDDIFDDEESFQSRFTLDLSSSEFDGEDEDELNGESSRMDDATEVMCLTALLLFWESNTDELEDEMVMDANDELAIMAIVETLQREGLVTISGSGRFFDPNNKATPVKNATQKAKKILKKKSAK